MLSILTFMFSRRLPIKGGQLFQMKQTLHYVLLVCNSFSNSQMRVESFFTLLVISTSSFTKLPLLFLGEMRWLRVWRCLLTQTWWPEFSRESMQKWRSPWTSESPLLPHICPDSMLPSTIKKTHIFTFFLLFYMMLFGFIIIDMRMFSLWDFNLLLVSHVVACVTVYLLVFYFI